MLTYQWDRGSRQESLDFVRAYEFGQLIATGRGRSVAVAVPTPFVLTSDESVLIHLAKSNPVFAAIAENPEVLLSVVGDWAYIPGSWKAIDGEDPRLGIPTTYYAAVQLRGAAEVLNTPDVIADVLRTQLYRYEGGLGLADPATHASRLRAIRGIHVTIEEVNGKFKFGGNVDLAHRRAVAGRLLQRNEPGDDAARRHLVRRAEQDAAAPHHQ